MMNQSPPDATIGKQKKFKGVSINSGRVFGATCMYSAERHKAVPQYSLLTAHAVEQELERFSDVLMQCSTELNRIASDVANSIGKAESEIFLTQKHIMNDPKVVNAVREMVSTGRRNVEWAISEVLSSYEDRFARLDSQYLRERSSDIGEIRRRLLGQLSNKKAGFLCSGRDTCSRGNHKIIVAEELMPDMFVNMHIGHVMGFVTEHGGITSHAAIMARSLGVPAVSGIHDIMAYVNCGDMMLIDGDAGEVYLNPEPATVETLIPVEQVSSGAICVLGTPEGMQALANAGTIEDVRLAAHVGADGIGLLRTEIQFIKADRLLTENEQFAFYDEVMVQMQGKPVTFRMLDAGGDKPLPFLRIRKEANPYLGWRGSRFLLGNPQIFETQLRAFARLSKVHKVNILFPMIIDTTQITALLGRSREILSGIECNHENMQFGAMIEVPSAFLQAREILQLVDFASVGSNDLIQYLFAIDRGNELVSQDFDPEHPVFLGLLRSLGSIARELGKPLSICGEVAGRKGFTRLMLDAGISSLSMAPRLIPRVRNEMADYAAAREVAAQL